MAVVASVLTTNEIMISLADIHQGMTDYKKAEQGDLSPTENFFQSALNMSDEQYENFKFINGILFDAVTMTAGTVNISKLFDGVSKCAVKKLARGVTMAAIQGGKSVLGQIEATGKVNLFSLAIDSVIGGISGVAGGTAGRYAAAGVGSMGARLGLSGIISPNSTSFVQSVTNAPVWD